MQKCKNDVTQYFSGDENSPLGYGYCANGEELNVKKQGRDGNLWIVKLNNNEKEWEEFQTYPYISIIIWIDNLEKEFKNFSINMESPECFKEIELISSVLDENEVSYEIGWTEHEIDFELYDNFENLDDNFFEKINNIKKLTFDKKIFLVRKSESVFLSLKNDEEQIEYL